MTILITNKTISNHCSFCIVTEKEFLSTFNITDSLVADTSTETALQELHDSFEKAKAFPNEFKELLAKIHEIPQLKNKDVHDKEVAGAVLHVKGAIETTFIHVRPYITKCHELADYIGNEE